MRFIIALILLIIVLGSAAQKDANGKPAGTQSPPSDLEAVRALHFCACRSGLPFQRTAPAWASSAKEAPAHGKAEGESARELGTPNDPNIDMPGLVAPVVVDGELHRYVYLSLKLTARRHRAAIDVARENSVSAGRLPARGARGFDCASTTIPRSWMKPASSGRLMHVCETVVGAGIVKEIEIMKPSQSGF